VVGGDLLDRPAATDRLHGDPGLELGTVRAALAHRWESPFRGSTPPQRLTMGAVQESQTTSNTWLIAGAGSTIRSGHILPSRGVRPWK